HVASNMVILLILVLIMRLPALCLTLFPYTTLFRSQVDGVLLQRLARLLGVLILHALTAAHLVDRRFKRLLRRAGRLEHLAGVATDRKSTRLNSSHVKISYAVFCLKKKIP